MASVSPRFLFAGGGTGGHLFPGLAVATALRQRDPTTRIQFVGSERSLEKSLVIQHGHEHRTLPSEPLTQAWRRPWSFAWRNWRAYRVARKWLHAEPPDAVIGLGGFASAPLVLAASRLGIPSVLLEQNSIPGRSTRWLSRFANVVCLAYPDSVNLFKPTVQTRLTGNPLREEIAALASIERFETPPATLLILGGSQGAQPLNSAVVEMLQTQPDLLSGWHVVHQTGAAQSGSVQQAYRQLEISNEVAPFFHDMAERYQAATLVISRAGATTLAELACAGVPAILVPYPQSADNHQWHNAKALSDAGAAVLCEQRQTPAQSAEDLAAIVRELSQAPSKRADMSESMRSLALPDATNRVVEVIMEVIAGSADSSIMNRK